MSENKHIVFEICNAILDFSDISKTYNDHLLYSTDLVDSITHILFEKNDIYNFYKTLGNSTLNKSVVKYMPNRFPVLQHPSRINVLSSLKIHIISNELVTKKFEEIFKLSKLIELANLKDREPELDKVLLTNTLKAIIGLIEWKVDEHILRGVGSQICYNLISNLLNNVQLSLKYTDLTDPNTILNELVTKYRIKKIEEEQVEGEGENKKNTIRVFLNNRLYGEGVDRLKKEAKFIASKNAILQLEKEGIVRETPEAFRDL